MSSWFAVLTIVVGSLIVLMLVWFLGWQTGIRDAEAKRTREGRRDAA